MISLSLNPQNLKLNRDACRLRVSEIIGQSPTCLSSNVSLILDTVKQANVPVNGTLEDAYQLFVYEGNIDWVGVARLLCSSMESCVVPWQRSAMWYLEHTRKLVPFFKECERWLISSTDDAERHNLLANLAWLREVDLVSYCLAHWWNPDSSPTAQASDVLESLLLMTALMEGSFRTLLSHENKRVPMLLREILASQDLEDIFGHEKVLLLQLLMGSPHSLNLRNLSWHGFLSQGEMPSAYVACCLVVCGSLGLHLKQSRRTIQNRIWKTFPIYAARELPVFPEFEREVVKQAITDVRVLFPGMKTLWRKAVDHYGNEKYGLCAVLLLPQLEHLLRTLSAALGNECSAMTADCSVFYVTYDTLLCPPSSDEWCSSWLRILGKDLYAALRDLLCFPEGPRFRDRISHGECCISTIPKEWTSFLLFVSLSVINLFGEDSCQEILYCSNFSNYKSTYHPSSILQRTLLDAMKSSDMLKQFLQTELTSEQRNNLQVGELFLNTIPLGLREIACDYLKLLSNSQNMTNFVETLTLDWICQLGQQESDISNIASSLKSSELVTSLVEIVSSILGNYEKLATSKLLRSRQRQTYENMLKTIPRLSQTIHFVLVLNTSCLIRTNPSTKEDFDFVNLAKLLKSSQKVMEQVYSYYNSSKNRWDEAVKSVDKYFKRLEELVNNIPTYTKT